jgi:hypothetical protein
VRHIRKIVLKLKIKRIRTLKKIKIESEIKTKKIITPNLTPKRTNLFPGFPMLSRITGKTELTSRQLLIIFNSITQKFTLAEKTAERNRIFFWFFRVKIEKQCRPTKKHKAENYCAEIK